VSNKIDKLTPEQEAKIQEYRELGLKIGHSTEPMDIETMVDGVQKLYEFCREVLEPKAKEAGEEYIVPDTYYAVSSPSAAQKLLHELTGKDGFISNQTYGYGQHESYWIAYYRYFVEVLKIIPEEKAKEGLYIMNQIANSGGWFYMMSDCFIIVDRPEYINLNDANQSHSETDYAIKYRKTTQSYDIKDYQGVDKTVTIEDDFGIYVIDGHLIPLDQAYIVTNPEKITTDAISQERDVEIQRFMIQQYGVSEYLTDIKAKVLDADYTGLDGSSLRTLMEDNTGMKWLVGSDGSTGRVYHMSVPDEASTCSEAHQLIAGFDESRIISES
jgi:hypothetical protein